MNNSSFFTADRTTHLKIVVVSLLASVLILVIGIAARPQPPNAMQAAAYKPPKAIMAVSDPAETVR